MPVDVVDGLFTVELDFGEGFGFWWYDEEGSLNPKTPSWHDSLRHLQRDYQDDIEEDYDDDIPF